VAVSTRNHAHAELWPGRYDRAVGRDGSLEVRLSAEQIAFVRESLAYSERALRDHDYGSVDRAWVTRHRREQEEIITSIRKALREAH
jgi:hypothetical protein